MIKKIFLASLSDKNFSYHAFSTICDHFLHVNVVLGAVMACGAYLCIADDDRVLSLHHTPVRGDTDGCGLMWMIASFAREAAQSPLRPLEFEAFDNFTGFLKADGFARLTTPKTVDAVIELASRRSSYEEMYEKAGAGRFGDLIENVYVLRDRNGTLDLELFRRKEGNTYECVKKGAVREVATECELPNFTRSEEELFNRKSQDLTRDICDRIVGYLPWRISDVPARFLSVELLKNTWSIAVNTPKAVSLASLERAPEAVRRMDCLMKRDLPIIQRILDSMNRQNDVHESYDEYNCVRAYDHEVEKRFMSVRRRREIVRERLGACLEDLMMRRMAGEKVSARKISGLRNSMKRLRRYATDEALLSSARRFVRAEFPDLACMRDSCVKARDIESAALQSREKQVNAVVYRSRAI